MKVVKAAKQSKYESKISVYIIKFMNRHPFIAFFIIFVGGPLITLLAVVAAVYLIALPLGFIMGWF